MSEVKLWDCFLEWEYNGQPYPVVEMREVVPGKTAEPFVLHSDYAALEAEAKALREFKARVMALAVGRCEFCAHSINVKPTVRPVCIYCQNDDDNKLNWTPAWGAEGEGE